MGKPRNKKPGTGSRKKDGLECCSHDDDKRKLSPMERLPIVYSDQYNIGFLGIEKLHPFDSGKWGRIFNTLKEAGMINEDNIHIPREATEQELLKIHSKDYINKLQWSINVASITEVPLVALLPNFVVQAKVLRPLRFQTDGTVKAAFLAISKGWSINIGGGFHHCSSDSGGGFCAYADITLGIKSVFEHERNVKNVMIVDLDAHQGNGHERDFMCDERVYIMDVYNKHIYPGDNFAKNAIRRKVELNDFTTDDVYLDAVSRHLESALDEFSPDLLVYNAGTDILADDPLGRLSISAKGVIKRDEIVFHVARERRIPIVMLTSGGYRRSTAGIIADSILNLRRNRLIGANRD